MTEAVFLALIALVGVMMFNTTSIILVNIVLKYAPTHFKFWTGYGHMEVDFDSKVDE